jgi:maspardin
MQILKKTNRHVISVQFPGYFSTEEFVEGFAGFLHVLQINRAHLYGMGLGGYLLLHFASKYPDSVASLALTNCFADTSDFTQSSLLVSALAYLPSMVLLNYVLEALPKRSAFPDVIDFVVEHLETLQQEDLAARLTLNFTDSRVGRVAVDPARMLFLDSDEPLAPGSMRARLRSSFPRARVHPVDGGDFPVLAAPVAVTAALLAHVHAAEGHAPEEECAVGQLEFDADLAVSDDELE